MTRKIAIISSLFLWMMVGGISSKALALGLGDIELKSYLNQPLYAEIKLNNARALVKDEVLVGLASKKDFDSAGVDRSFLVTQLKFNVEMDPGKGAYIKVVTNRPIREPFINFLVEVHWPTGRLLREYTVLLDPPLLNDARPPVLSVPRTEAPKAPLVNKGTVSRDRLVSDRSNNRITSQNRSEQFETFNPGIVDNNTAPTGQSYPDSVYEVKRNDTLGLIAKKIKPRDKTLNQVMLAIQRANPDAFIDGNINLVKAGEVLRLPSEEEINATSRQEAIEEVRVQMDAWRNYKSNRAQQSNEEAYSGPQLKSSEENVTQDESVYDGEGVLRIHSPSDASELSSTDDTTGSSGQASGNVSALKSQVILAEEEFSKSQLALEDLNNQMGELTDQIQTSDQILKLKDDHLASLKARLAEIEQDKFKLDDPTAQDPSIAEGISQESANDPLFSDEVADESFQYQDEALQEGLVADNTATGEEFGGPLGEEFREEFGEEFAGEFGDKVSEEVSEEVDPQLIDPVMIIGNADEEAAAPLEDFGYGGSKPSLIDTLMSPIVLGGLVVVILLLIVGIMLARRSNDQSEDTDLESAVNHHDELGSELDIESGDETLMEFAHEDATLLDPNDETVVDDLDFDDDSEDDPTVLSVEDQTVTEVSVDHLDDDMDSPADMILIEEANESDDETAELLGEADIEIAYGHFDKSLALLQQASAISPHRPDIHSKILDIYKESENTNGFQEAANRAISLGDPDLTKKANQISKMLNKKLSGNSEKPKSATHSGSGGLNHPVSAASLVDDEELDFDLDLDEGLDVTQIVAEDQTLTDIQLNDSVGSDEEITLEDLELSLTTSGADDSESLDDLDVSIDDSLDDIELNDPEAFESSMDSSGGNAPKSDGFEGEMNQSLESVLEGDEIGEADSLDDLGLELDLSNDDSHETTKADISPKEATQSPNQVSDDSNEADTKLDLARAYIDMGDNDGARDILDEVVSEGNPAQQSEARELLQKCG